MTSLFRRSLTAWAAAILAITSVGVVPLVAAPEAHATSSVSGVVNTYQAVSAVSGSAVTVTGGLTGAGTPFAVGDKVMLIQMTGAPPSQGSNFGNYDVATITAISGSTITLSAITRTYSAGTEAVQLVRFYSDTGVTTVTGDVTAKPWDGVTGGVVAMNGQTLSLSSNIDASGTGFNNTNTPTSGVFAPQSSGQGATAGQGQAGPAAPASIPTSDGYVALGGGGTGGGGGTNSGGPGGLGGSLGNGGSGFNTTTGTVVVAPGTNGGIPCTSPALYDGAIGGAGGGGGVIGGGGGGGATGEGIGTNGEGTVILSAAGGGGGGVAGGGAGGAAGVSDTDPPIYADTDNPWYEGTYGFRTDGYFTGVPCAGATKATGMAGGGGGVGASGNGADGLIGGVSGTSADTSFNEGSAGGGGGSYGGGGGAASNASGGDDSSGGGGGGSWTGGGTGGPSGGQQISKPGGDGNAAIPGQIPDSAQYLNTTNPRLMMGGAGGKGSSEAGYTLGGAGGGIVYTDFTTITGGGQIVSDGADGRSPAQGGAHSGSGAGAGGQMRIRAVTITASNLVLAVNGGVGGAPTANNFHGGVSGGGGGAGGVWLELASATASCPVTTPIPNVTFETAGGDSGASIVNPKNDEETGRAGNGAAGLACVSPLADEMLPNITFEKTLKSSTPAGDGSYTVVYDIVVTNDGDDIGTYDLSDTLRPGAGAVFVSGSWTGPTTGTFEAADVNNPKVLATGRTLTNVAPANVEIYTVTVKYTINNAAIVTTVPDNSMDCAVTTGEPDGNTGFNNVASLTTDGVTTTDDACAPFGVITFDKTLKSSTLNADGSYTVVYDIVVTNDSGPNPGGAPAAYDLSDTLRPGAGAVFVSGTWTGETSGTFTGANVATVLVNDHLLTNVAGSNVDTYTVTAKYTIDNAAIVDDSTNDSTDCTVTAGETNGNTGFRNVASLTTGGGTTNDDACGPFEPKLEPEITFVKDLVSSTPNGDGTYDVVYDIVVTNNGGAPGTYDLSDTLRPGAGAVFVSGGWDGPGALDGTFVAADVNTPKVLVTGRSLTDVAPGNVETFRVSVTYSIDNAAIVQAAPDNSTDCAVTTGEPDGNTGFNNVASLTFDGETTTDGACAPFGVITFDKTLKSSTLNADGSYDVVYDIVVTNTSGAAGAPAAYDLSDTLRPGAGAVFVSGAWSGETSGTFSGPNVSTVLANDRLLTNIAPNHVAAYTVSVKYTIDTAAIVSNPNSADCTIAGSEIPDGNTGFNNVASLTTGDETTTDDACAPFGVISFDKKLVSSTPNGDGSYDVVYDIVVTNAGGSPATYDLSDTLRPGAGAVFASGSWTGPGGLSGTFTGPNVATTFVTGRTLTNVAPGNVETYTVSVKYTIDNAAVAAAPENPMDCAATGSELPSGNTGFNNVATLVTGGKTTTDDACAPFGVISFEKTLKTSTMNADGSYDVVYDIVVTNTSGAAGAPAAYDLSDTLRPGAGAVFVSGSWSGETSGSFSGPNVSTVLASDRLLTNADPDNVDTYTVSVKYTVDNAAVVTAGNNSSDCAVTGAEDPDGNTGFNNVASLTTGGETVDDDACAPFGTITMEKTVVSSTANANGTYDVIYEILVTNNSGAAGAPATYDLSDTLRPGAGAVFVSGTWSGETSGTFAAANTATVLADDHQLTNVAPDHIDTYRVSVRYRIDNTAVITTPDSTDCAVTGAEDPSGNTGFNNVASLTTGGQTTTDDACAPFGKLTIEKKVVSSTLNANGSYDVVYDIVVTNTSGATGAPAAYDLSDTLRPGAGAVYVAGSWSGETSGSFTGANLPTVLADDHLLTNTDPDNVDTYTVSVTYTVDNAAVVTAGDNSSDCATTGSELPDGNTGFNNVAIMTTGGQSTDDDACAPFGTVTFTKELVSSTANADGTYDVIYSIVVRNDSGTAGAPATYDLSDTLRPGAGAVWVSGSWSGATSGTFTGANTATELAKGRPLSNVAPDNVDTYTVSVRYTIDNSAVTTAPDSTDCAATGSELPNGNTGFNNVASLTTGGSTTADDACAPFGVITFEKTLNKSTLNPDGSYTVVYDIVVTNSSLAPAAYDLSDTLRPGAGAVFASGSWSGETSGTFTAANTATVLVTDHLLTNVAAGNVDTYTVTATYTIDTDAVTTDPDSTDCTVSGSELPNGNTGFNNVASMTTGGNTTTDDACAPFGTVTFTKDVVSSTANADGTYDVVYEIVVTNNSGAAGAPVNYDLADTLRPGAGALFVSGTWSGETSGTFTAANAPTVLADDHQLTNVDPDHVDTYRVSVTYRIDNTAVITAPENSADCTATGSELPDGNTGFNNVASLTSGGKTTDDACAPFGTITFTKDVVSSTANADGTYDVVYDIVVTNTSGATGAPAAYDLSDTLRPGVGAVFVSGSWSGETSGTFTAANTATVLVTDHLLTNVASNNVDTYTVSVKYRIDSDAVTADPDSTDCTVSGSESPDGNTGFNNVASLTTGGQTTTDDACAPFGKVTFVKDVVSSTANTDGSYDVVYNIVVTNNSGPEGAPAAYDLSDTLRPGAGAVFVSGSWSGETSGTFTAANTATVLAKEHLLTNAASGNVDTYSVSVKYAIDSALIVPTPDDSTDCTATGSELPDGNTGFNNVASLTSGGKTTTDDACAPFGTVTFVKDLVSSTLQADGTYDVVYNIVVTNAGGPDGAPAAYDLSDTLRPGAGAELVSGSWSGETSGTFSAVNSATSLAEDRVLTNVSPNNVDTYTVVVKYMIDESAIVYGGADNSTDCKVTSGEPDGITGFHNVASLTTGGETTTDDACAPFDVPKIKIVKGDDKGNTADTADEAVQLADGTAKLVYSITNNGTEDLKDVKVTDTVVSNGKVTGLSCDFSALGGPASGTTWVGPFAVGATFDCTADLIDVEPGSVHENIGTVTGKGVVSGKDVDDDNPYHGVKPVQPTPTLTPSPTTSPSPSPSPSPTPSPTPSSTPLPSTSSVPSSSDVFVLPTSGEDAPLSSGPLANTGAGNVAGWLFWAGILFAAGMAFLVLGRRKAEH